MGSDENTPASFNKIVKGTVSGGVIINAIFTPFDVVKNFWVFSNELTKCRTKLTSIDVAKHIYANRGLPTFWMGVQWATPLTIVGHSVFLYTYDSIKGVVPPPVASLISRFVTMFVAQPFDCMRTYTQATLNANRDTVAEIVRKNGVMALYKGAITTLIRDVPFSIIHWPVNEFFYSKIKGWVSVTRSMEMYKKREMTHAESIMIPFACGTFSSLLATFASQPLDVIKTNLQAAGVDSEEAKTHKTAAGKLNMWTEMKRIKSMYGVRGLFVGVAPRLLKVVPGSAIMSAAYHFFN